MNQREQDPNKIRDILRQRAIQQRRPLSAMLELTYRCNFNCKMCYVHMTDEQAAPYGRMRTVDEWLDMARQLKEAGVLFLDLTGGECTLYPGFEKLYRELCQMGFFIGIKSNAAVYTPAIRQLFTDYPPRSAIISLYGESNETYAAVTGDPKGYDKTLKNIRFFQSIGVHVDICYTVIRQNVLDYPKIVDFCRNNGFKLVAASDIHPHLWNPAYADIESCRLSPAERACIDSRSPEEVELALNDATELKKELANFRSFPPSMEVSIRKPRYCNGAFSACAILWNGDMDTCLGLARGSIYKPFEVGFEVAWRHLQSDMPHRFRLLPECQACPLRNDCTNNCIGHFNEHTGQSDKMDEFLCQYTYLKHLYQNSQKFKTNGSTSEIIHCHI